MNNYVPKLTWAVIFILSYSVSNVLLQEYKCPKGCKCLPKTFRCFNIRLRRIPAENIPEDTTVLDLRYNYISELVKEDLDKLPNLENLFLENNIVKYIEPYAFSRLKKLKHLHMLSNKLETIEENTFSGLLRLEQLYLQNNAIRNIAPSAFKDLVRLERLYLHQNSLTTISKDLIKPMVSLRRIRLASNQIQCSCSFIRVVEELYVEDKIYIGATCFYKGREVQAYSITYTDLSCYRPRFAKKPSDQEAVAGSTITLACEGEGVPAPRVSWLRDGKELNGNLEYTLDGDGTLTLKNFSAGFAGYYQCIIQNDIGKSAAGASVSFLSYEAIPSFIEQPRDVDSVAGGGALFSCRATGYPRPNIIWKKNGRLLDLDSRVKVLQTGDLQFISIILDDAGYYTCEARNDLGTAAHSAQLTVKAAPTFIHKPEDHTLLDGDTASFDCKAIGFPQPAIAWQKDGSRLPSDGKHVVLPSGTLRILHAREENEGLYECQAINVIGVISVQANLTVNPRG